MLVASLTVICDRLLAITGFLSAYFGQLFPSFTCHNKVPAFLTWLRSLSKMAFVQFFIAQFSFAAKICLFLSATRKNSLQNFVDQSLYLDSGLITCRSHHSMTSIMRLYSNHTLLDQSKREFYAVHCIIFNNRQTLFKLKVLNFWLLSDSSNSKLALFLSGPFL